MNTERITVQQVNHTKKEVTRLKKLKKRYRADPEAMQDLNRLINRNLRYIEAAQQKIEDAKIR